MKVVDLLNDIRDPRMEDYCNIKHNWLSKHVDLSNGTPSESTFRRLFTLLDPKFLEALLKEHASEIVQTHQESDQIAIDGKSLRGSKRGGHKILHSVSAWCYENSLVLGEEQVHEKSNELTAIPMLLKSLDIKGNTISIDAMGCQKSIVDLIRDRAGHYVLGLKKNHRKLYEAVKEHTEQVGMCDDNRLEDAFDESHNRLV